MMNMEGKRELSVVIDGKVYRYRRKYFKEKI